MASFKFEHQQLAPFPSPTKSPRSARHAPRARAPLSCSKKIKIWPRTGISFSHRLTVSFSLSLSLSFSLSFTLPPSLSLLSRAVSLRFSLSFTRTLCIASIPTQRSGIQSFLTLGEYGAVQEGTTPRRHYKALLTKPRKTLLTAYYIICLCTLNTRCPLAWAIGLYYDNRRNKQQHTRTHTHTWFQFPSSWAISSPYRRQDFDQI